VNVVNVELNALIVAGDAAKASRDPAVTAKLNSPEVTAAGQRLAAYITKKWQPEVTVGRKCRGRRPKSGPDSG
jgi:hypothetical protein